MLAETLERERKRLDHLLFGAGREDNSGHYFAVRSAILARAARSMRVMCSSAVP